MIWFTRESWKYMSGRKYPVRFILGYPRALYRYWFAPY
jgi:hypothetical protein